MSDAVTTTARSPTPPNPVLVIARKDVVDALRDRFLIGITLFLTAAALVSVVSGGLALAADAQTYEAARATLLALGKRASTLAPPEFHPLRLLRGTVEQIEIIGAVVAILAGHRSATSERGNRTLDLLLTRPIGMRRLLAGKLLAGLLLMGMTFGAVLGVSGLALHLVGGVGLHAADVGRIGIAWLASCGYATAFFALSFAFSMRAKRPGNALPAAFVVWLLVVLVAPQVGDTLDPDNQVAGGTFRQLGIDKAGQTEIMKGFATFDTVRNAIESASVTKRFERLNFAVLGVKASELDKPLPLVLSENAPRIGWLLLALSFAIALSTPWRIDPERLPANWPRRPSPRRTETTRT